MIHILLVILKIIGIIVLVLLGIVLALVLLVLLVPLRYRLKAAYDGKPVGFLRASWLFCLVSYRAEYNEAGLVQALRVLGLRIWSWQAEAEEVKDGAEAVLSKEEQDLYEELGQDERARRESGGYGQEEPGKACEESGDYRQEQDRGQSGGFNQEPELLLEEEDLLLGAQSLPEEPPQDSGPVRKGLFSRIGDRVRGFFEKLRFSFRTICGKLRDIKTLIQAGRAWMEDEKNQASARLLLRQARRLLRHIFPLKGHGSVTFGFEDPGSTGQVLAAVSPFYPLYHKILELHPVFDESVLRAQADIRGRIRLLTLLWLAFQLYRDKHTWKLIRKFMK